MSEVRPIDANGLIKIVNNEKAPDWWKEIIRGWIKKQPTVDAVPVVRCRECKHRGTHKCKLFRTEFNEWSIEFESIDLTQPDWFCADGDNSDNGDLGVRMKQLHKDILKVVALLCIGLVLTAAGCVVPHTDATQPEGDHGLVKVDNYRGFVVFEHVDTGVYYLYSGYGGFIPLLNADGTPYCGGGK